MPDKIKELEGRIEALKNVQLKAIVILERFNEMVEKQQKVIERMVSIMEFLTKPRKEKDEVPRYIG